MKLEETAWDFLA